MVHVVEASGRPERSRSRAGGPERQRQTSLPHGEAGAVSGLAKEGQDSLASGPGPVDPPDRGTSRSPEPPRGVVSHARTARFASSRALREALVTRGPSRNAHVTRPDDEDVGAVPQPRSGEHSRHRLVEAAQGRHSAAFEGTSQPAAQAPWPARRSTADAAVVGRAPAPLGPQRSVRVQPLGSQRSGAHALWREATPGDVNALAGSGDSACAMLGPIQEGASAPDARATSLPQRPRSHANMPGGRKEGGPPHALSGMPGGLPAAGPSRGLLWVVPGSYDADHCGARSHGASLQCTSRRDFQSTIETRGAQRSSKVDAEVQQARVNLSRTRISDTEKTAELAVFADARSVTREREGDCDGIFWGEGREDRAPVLGHGGRMWWLPLWLRKMMGHFAVVMVTKGFEWRFDKRFSFLVLLLFSLVLDLCIIDHYGLGVLDWHLYNVTRGLRDFAVDSNTSLDSVPGLPLMAHPSVGPDMATNITGMLDDGFSWRALPLATGAAVAALWTALLATAALIAMCVLGILSPLWSRVIAFRRPIIFTIVSLTAAINVLLAYLVPPSGMCLTLGKQAGFIAGLAISLSWASHTRGLNRGPWWRAPLLEWICGLGTIYVWMASTCNTAGPVAVNHAHNVPAAALPAAALAGGVTMIFLPPILGFFWDQEPERARQPSPPRSGGWLARALHAVQVFCYWTSGDGVKRWVTAVAADSLALHLFFWASLLAATCLVVFSFVTELTVSLGPEIIATYVLLGYWAMQTTRREGNHARERVLRNIVPDEVADALLKESAAARWAGNFGVEVSAGHRASNPRASVWGSVGEPGRSRSRYVPPGADVAEGASVPAGSSRRGRRWLRRRSEGLESETGDEGAGKGPRGAKVVPEPPGDAEGAGAVTEPNTAHPEGPTPPQRSRGGTAGPLLDAARSFLRFGTWVSQRRGSAPQAPAPSAGEAPARVRGVRPSGASSDSRSSVRGLTPGAPGQAADAPTQGAAWAGPGGPALPRTSASRADAPSAKGSPRLRPAGVSDGEDRVRRLESRTASSARAAILGPPDPSAPAGCGPGEGSGAALGARLRRASAAGVGPGGSSPRAPRGGSPLASFVSSSTTDLIPPQKIVFLKEYECVTMVFSDVVSFTDISSNSNPRDVLTMLHTYFTSLDDFVKSVGAYKYETVGDAYVVAVNLDKPDPMHAITALKVAAAIVDTASRVSLPGTNGAERMRVRVGMHTGPVVAGVLGKTRNVMTLVGDTLNVASRMESLGKAGHVQMTDATFAHLSAPLQRLFAARNVNVKGKGPMVTHMAQVDAAMRQALLSPSDLGSLPSQYSPYDPAMDPDALALAASLTAPLGAWNRRPRRPSAGDWGPPPGTGATRRDTDSALVSTLRRDRHLPLPMSRRDPGSLSLTAPALTQAQSAGHAEPPLDPHASGIPSPVPLSRAQTRGGNVSGPG